MSAPRRYVALLRAINVGGRTVKMDVLREQFEALGFANVSTFIASGNVIFETRAAGGPALERKIERRLRDALGWDVATILRSVDEIAAAAAHRPFPKADGDGHTLYVLFAQGAPGEATRRALEELRTPTDDLHLHGREVYWLRQGSIADSPVSGARLERAIGLPATMRNITTVRRLAAKYGG